MPSNDTSFIFKSTTITADWANQVNRYVFSAASVSAIRSLTGTALVGGPVYSRVRTLGYYTPGDGGGGDYWLDPSDTTSADNGGTIIVAGNGARWKLAFSTTFNVRQFGAKGDGATDDSASIQSAVVAAGAAYDADWFSTTIYTTTRAVDFVTGSYKVLSKILVPRGVFLRGNNSQLFGSGFTSGDNDCFESAYFNAGVLTTNIGTSPESHRIQYTHIEGFKFTHFRTSVNLFNFNEGCALRDCAFFDVQQAVVASRCFYGEFTNLMNRGSAGGETLPCFSFSTFVNVETIRNVSAIGRVLGMQFDTGINGLLLTSVNTEGCTNGIKFLGEINPLNIDSCYFEGISGTALDFTDAAAHRAVTIDNNWFNTVGTAISGVEMLSGKIGAGNYFLNVTTAVNIVDNVSTITVEIPPSRATSGYPSVPSSYQLGLGIRTVYPFHIFDGGSGNSTVRQDYTGGLLPLPFSGKQGYQASQIAFCVTSTTGTTTMTGFVDTKIVFEPYVMFGYSLLITDNVGSYTLCGHGYGLNTTEDVTSLGKAVTSSNNGGFLRLSITGLTHPSGIMGAEGVVRIM